MGGSNTRLVIWREGHLSCREVRQQQQQQLKKKQKTELGRVHVFACRSVFDFTMQAFVQPELNPPLLVRVCICVCFA